MLKTIYNKYEKTLIPSLPIAHFQGKIIVVLTPGETERAVRFLLSQPILGFDTETRPSFRKGHQHKVSLLQVSTPDICFLFRLNYTGLTDSLIQLLEDENVLKIGLSWHDDINALHKLKEFNVGKFIDIQHVASELGIEDLSLQKIYANLFAQKISKRQQLSNWEADVLTDKQKTYAATDAWACIQIYNEIIRLRQTNDYKLIIKAEDKHEASISEKG